MNTKQIFSGTLALAFAALMVVPAEARDLRRNRIDRHPGSGGGHHYRHDGPRHHRGAGPFFDGGLILGVLGLGILIDALVDDPPPVVVYEPPPVRYRRYAPREWYRSYDLEEYYDPSDPGDYPSPKRYYPECKEFAGNPGAMAFCEKGVLERENEEQRRIEQRAYESGRGR